MKFQKHDGLYYMYVLGMRYSSPNPFHVLKAAIKYKLKCKEWYK